MRALIFIFFIALMTTGISTPFVRRLAIRLGFVDNPAARKLHENAMPLMGGVAIFAGAMFAAILLILLLLFAPELAAELSLKMNAPQVIGIALACTMVALVGLLDDRSGLIPWQKLLGQAAAVTVLIYFDVHIKLPLPLWLNYFITLCWILGISNAINFLDNMDGLSAGISAVVAAFILLLGALHQQHLVGALAAAVLGACLGFLRYNFKPAQIFMGDAGSLFLGFVLAVLGLQLRFPTNVNAVTWMVPIFIFGVPIFDTTLVIVARLRRGVNPLTTAGKDHTSHRLVQLGFTQREAVLILYLLSGVMGMIAIFITQADLLEGYLIGFTIAMMEGWLIWWLVFRVGFKQ